MEDQLCAIDVHNHISFKLKSNTSFTPTCVILTYLIQFVSFLELSKISKPLDHLFLQNSMKSSNSCCILIGGLKHVYFNDVSVLLKKQGQLNDYLF
jgi:hypothetical protein